MSTNQQLKQTLVASLGPDNSHPQTFNIQQSDDSSGSGDIKIDLLHSPSSNSYSDNDVENTQAHCETEELKLSETEKHIANTNQNNKATSIKKQSSKLSD